MPQLSGGDEIIVIDTGSTDGTLEFLQSHSDPRVHLHPFAGQGSWAEARNFGVDQAQGELIAFIDDDCYAAPDWVARGRAAFAASEAVPDAVGGLVLPHEITSWPDWWHPDMGWLIGLSVPGHRGPEAGRYFYPATANLWARAALIRAERFQELGGSFEKPDGAKYQTGREDAEWWRRIRVRGYRTKFDPALLAEHDIDPARIDFAYLMERARRDGEAWARREGVAEDLDPLAYRWWLAAAPPGAIDEKNSLSRRRLQELYRARQRSALIGLTRKLAEVSRSESAMKIRSRALLHAGFRLARDRAKTFARRIALAYSPPQVRSLPEAPPKRIGVAAFGFLGDMVILQSALRGVVQSNPGGAISLLAPPAAVPVFRDVSGIALTPMSVGEASFEEAQSAIWRWLGENKPGVILAPYLHGTGGAALARMKNPAIPVVTFDRDEGLKRQIDRERIALKAEKKMSEHESVNLARLFEFVGLKSEPVPSEIRAAPKSLEEATAWVRGFDPGAFDRPLLMLNPDAGQSNKEWTDEAWVHLMQSLIDELPHALVVNLSRPRPQLEAAAFAAMGSTPRVQWLRQAPLERLIAQLSLCEGIITVDAGPQHLAHALGVPSLTLYGPSDERRWGDLKRRPVHQTLRGGSFDLTPEELRGLPENHLMRLITPEAMIEKVRSWKKFLGSKNREQ